MAKTKPIRPVRLRHSIDVELQPVPFVPFESARRVDLAKLARASHAEVEIGRFESDCCHRIVRAIVKQGRVVAYETDPCSGKKRTPAPAEFEKLIAQAKRKTSTGGGGPKLPMPVARLANTSGLGDFIKWSEPQIWTCVRFCGSILGIGFCITCCVETTIKPGEKRYSCFPPS